MDDLTTDEKTFLAMALMKLAVSLPPVLAVSAGYAIAGIAGKAGIDLAAYGREHGYKGCAKPEPEAGKAARR